MVSMEDEKSYLVVEDGKIAEIGTGIPNGSFERKIDLNGRHVYPCLIDAHVHLLLTVAVMAMGFNACEITKDGVVPNTIKGVEQRIRE